MRPSPGLAPALIIAFGASLAGCGHLGPARVTLASDTPARYGEAEAEAGGAAPAAEASLDRWWRQFQDPVLNDLVGRSLAANLDLRETAARIEQARQQEVVAGAQRLPQLQAEGDASRTRISENAIPLPPGAASGGSGAGAPSLFGLPGSEFNSFRLGIDASWQVDLFGGASSGVAAARARTRSAQWSRRDLQVSLAAEVADHYIALRGLQRREAVSWDELARQRELLSIVRARAAAGFVSHLDVAQQQSLVTATEARTYPLEAQARAEIHALGVLVGQPPEALIDLLTPARAQPVAPAPPPGLPSELLRRRPDIRRAEQEAAAAAAEVGVATADLYPKLTLSAQPAMVSTALSSLLDWGSRSYSVSAGLLWPVFEGGKLRAALAKADAREDEMLLAYRKTVLTALQDVEDALSRYQADDAVRGSLQTSLDDATSAEGLARDQYRAGLVGYANVLSAQQAVTSGADQLAQADAARARDVVALYKALGGGWSDQDLQEKSP